MTTSFSEVVATARARQSSLRDSLRSFFDAKEIDRLEHSRKAVQHDNATIAYCVYENPFAKSGGVFAVADNYCSTLQKTGKNVIVLTPFHSRLRSAPNDSDVQRIGRCRVPFGDESIDVEIFQHVRNDVRWVLLRAKGFFEADGGGGGGMDPYVDSDPTRLLRDSLFISAAIPEALGVMGMCNDVIVHAQDWEMAATALTVKLALLKGRLASAAVVLTSHNPYDQALPPESLALITDRKFTSIPPAVSVYQHMIPLTDAPVTTVSQNFARELLSDPLQTYHFADHLQDTFRQHGVVGVDNGLFGQPRQVFSDRALQELSRGMPDDILAEKLAKRRRMLRVLSDYHDDRIVGQLDGSDGGPLAELGDSVPVFLMFGRMDPGQKGFDVLARAIENLPPGWGRFILTPIITDGASAFAEDLLQLAKSRPGEVVIYPFRMQQGYLEAMSGATFAVMPSLYEPFGGTTEPYLSGTPVVVRATGGLVQQACDVNADPDHATGIVFREATEGTGEQWIAVQTAPTPADRMKVPVYVAMVDALVAALTRAGTIYQSQPASYAAMLSHLFDRARQFSWHRAMEEYAAVYEVATR